MTHEQLTFVVLLSPPKLTRAERLEIIKARHQAMHKGQR